MGYRGKLEEQEEARRLRAGGATLADIASTLGVAKSSVSLWVRDVPFKPSPRRTGGRVRPNRLHDAKLAQIAEMNAVAELRMGALSEQAFLAAGAALYAGEGAKRDGEVRFTNTDPNLVAFFCNWLRRFFDIDEARMRVALYLHVGLDLDAAQAHWSQVTGVPFAQFLKPYRAVVERGVRHNKHEFGCVNVRYNSARTHREVMGLVRALLSSGAQHSGVAQSAERLTVNQDVESSSLSPGAGRIADDPAGP